MRRGPDNPLPVAVIGAGGRVGEYYLKALTAINAPVTAFDIDTERMTTIATQFSGIRVAQTMEEALAAAQIAYILTPDHIRTPALASLQTPNIQLTVIEKPLANNLEEARVLHSVAQTKGKKVIVGSTYRATPQFAEIKKGVEADEIGDVIKVRATYNHDLRQVKDDWRKVGEGQNFYYGAATHPVDMIMHIVGKRVVKVTATESRLDLLQGTDGFKRPELITITMLFKNGTIGEVSVNLVTPLPPGEHGTELEVEGTKGTYKAHNKKLPEKSDGEFLVYREGQDGWETRDVRPAYTINQLVATADAWAREDREDADNPNPFATIDQALDLAYVLDAAERSARSERTEHIVYQR